MKKAQALILTLAWLLIAQPTLAHPGHGHADPTVHALEHGVLLLFGLAMALLLSLLVYLGVKRRRNRNRWKK